MAVEVILKDVRAWWCNVHEPDKDRTDPKTGQLIKGKFSFVGIFSPTSDAGKAAAAAFEQAAREEFGDNYKAVLAAIESSKKCIRNGNHKLDGDGNVVEGFKDMLYISAKNKVKPIVIGRGGKNDVLTPESGKPYRGCYCNVKVSINGWKSKDYGNQMLAKIIAVQFVRDGEAFGSVMSADGLDDLGAEDGLGEASGAAVNDLF